MSIYPQPLPSPQRRQTRSHSGLSFIVVVGCLFFLMAAVFLGFFVLILPDDGMGLFTEKVAVVEIFGTILDAEDWTGTLEDCAESDSIAAVVLHVDSPGGAITPTQEIYEAVRKIKAEGKPVIAYMGSVAASGGYYAACAADEIYTMSGTLTGSIGVYMQMVNIADLLDHLGVEFDTIKKGSFKTAGDFSRDMKGHERAMFQAVIDDYYQQFLDAVTDSRERNKVSLAKGWNEPLPGGTAPDATGTASLSGIQYPSSFWGSLAPALANPAVISATPSSTLIQAGSSATMVPAAELVNPVTTTRNTVAKADADKLARIFADDLTKEEIRKRVASLAEGRVYTGRQAAAVGLADKIGTLQDAIDRAGEVCGLGKDPKTVTKDVKKSNGLFGLESKVDLLTSSRFLYLCPFGR